MLEAVEGNDKQNAGINGGRSVKAGTVLAVPPKCAVNDQPQRPPSQHDSVTVWHLGHSRCARTKMGASVVPQY